MAEEDKLVKVILAIRDGLMTIVEQLNDILGTYMPKMPKAIAIPDFNPEELMKHEWKGRKTGDGQYEKGTLNWGWDFKEQFSPPVIKVLEAGPLQIDQYEFTLEGRFIHTKKVKEASQ